MLENAYNILYVSALICDAVAMTLTLVRCITGKRVVDRLICVNMMCNESTLAIAILALYLRQSYLLDVCLIYVLLSFLAVIILTKVFTTVYLNQKKKEEQKNDR